MLIAPQHSRRASLFVLVLTLSVMAWRSSGRTNEQLVNNLVRNGAIKSTALLAAMKLVDRANFVPREQLSSAYDVRLARAAPAAASSHASAYSSCAC